MIADGRGRAVAFALAPGQAHELPMAPELLDCLPDVPGWVVGDRGYASNAFRQRIWNMGLIQVAAGWLIVFGAIWLWQWLLPGLLPPALKGLL